MKKLLIAILFIVPFHAHALVITSNGSVDFGDVIVGETSTFLAVSVTAECEVGDSFCNLQSNSFVSGFVFAGTTAPQLSEGQSGTWSALFAFRPLSPGEVTSAITFTGVTSSGDAISDDVIVRGNGIAASIPEPSTLGLLSVALLGLGFMRRKRSA